MKHFNSSRRTFKIFKRPFLSFCCFAFLEISWVKTTFRRSNTWLTAEPCSEQPEGTVWRHRQPKQRTSDSKQAGAMAKQWCLLLSETEEAEGEWEPRRRKWWLEITTKAEPRETLQNVGVGSGEVATICWGLYVENLPSLSPKLEYQVG